MSTARLSPTLVNGSTLGTITHQKQQGVASLGATSEHPFSTLILAGGRNSRMGTAKAALPFGATTILERLVAELAPVSDEIIVIAAPLTDETFAIADLLGQWLGQIRLLRDEAPFAGPVPALVRGLRAARNQIVFVCSCDLPLLRAAVARKLCALIGDYDVVEPEIEGARQPLCAAYKKDAAERIRALWRGGEGRVTAVVEQLHRRRVTGDEIVAIDPSLRSFVNINTREDYARALVIAGLKD